jgi:hypothetical protein
MSTIYANDVESDIDDFTDELGRDLDSLEESRASDRSKLLRDKVKTVSKIYGEWESHIQEYEDTDEDKSTAMRAFFRYLLEQQEDSSNDGELEGYAHVIAKLREALNR